MPAAADVAISEWHFGVPLHNPTEDRRWVDASGKD
jgi:hypothetical protein